VVFGFPGLLEVFVIFNDLVFLFKIFLIIILIRRVELDIELIVLHLSFLLLLHIETKAPLEVYDPIPQVDEAGAVVYLALVVQLFEILLNQVGSEDILLVQFPVELVK
jgi:hypothetical protein